MNHYTGWNRPLLVLLTDTDNQYLKPKLPLRGLLEVLEMGTNHKIIHASFRVGDYPNTNDGYSAPVQVKNPVFTYPAPEETPTDRLLDVVADAVQEQTSLFAGDIVRSFKTGGDREEYRP